MKQTHVSPKFIEPAPHLCQRCGGLMRLIGSEAHPREAYTDLLTYICTACDDFLVLPITIMHPAFGTIDNVDLLRQLEKAENRILIKNDSSSKYDNSHATTITCEKCSGQAHLTDCEPCATAPGVRDTWTFCCEACGESLKRTVER